MTQYISKYCTNVLIISILETKIDLAFSLKKYVKDYYEQRSADQEYYESI